MTGADVAWALFVVLFALLAWVARVLWRLVERVSRIEGQRNGRRD